MDARGVSFSLFPELEAKYRDSCISGCDSCDSSGRLSARSIEGMLRESARRA